MKLIKKLTKRRDGFLFSALFIGAISAGSYAIFNAKPNHDVYENSFFSTRGNILSDEALNMASLHKHFDVLTSAGWRGKVVHKADQQSLVMKLIDYVGKPINGMFIAASVRSNKGDKVVYNNMLRQSADGEYSAEKLNLKKGRWDLAIIGRNPDSSSETDLIFRFEKQITVK